MCHAKPSISRDVAGLCCCACSCLVFSSLCLCCLFSFCVSHATHRRTNDTSMEQYALNAITSILYHRGRTLRQLPCVPSFLLHLLLLPSHPFAHSLLQPPRHSPLLHMHIMPIRSTYNTLPQPPTDEYDTVLASVSRDVVCVCC